MARLSTPRALALDTNAYRALDDGHPELARLVQTTSLIGLPVIVLGEIYFGIWNGRWQERNAQELNRFLSTPRVDILHTDEHTARIFGEIAAELKLSGKPIQQNDIWIAALCKQHSYTLATADRGFKNILGLEVITFRA